MGRQIGMVQFISGLQKLWQNRRWANGIRVEYFPRIQYVATQWRSQTFTVEIRWDTREFHRKDHLHVDFNDISWWSRDNEQECLANAQLVSLLAKRFGAGQWSFLGPGSEKKWFYISEDSSQGEWEKMAELMMFKFGESGHPVFRATSPLSRGVLKSKGGGKLSIHFCADQETITTVFRTITSVNQLSLYGAVAEMCEEYESYHDRTGGPVVRGQSSSSFVPSVIKTNVSLNYGDPARKDFLLQRYGERIEKLSQQDRLSKFCTDAGFLTTVEVGQYLMTKDTEEFSQFTHSVACREYTLPREEDTSEPKGRIWGNIKIGPVLEVTTCCLQGKYGVEIRIMSVKKTILTHGSEFLTAWISWSRTWTTTSRKLQKCSSMNLRWNWVQVILHADQRPKQNHKTRLCQHIHKNYTCGEKNLDWCWTRTIFALQLSSVEETDPSSSSRKSPSWQRWSDRILENKRSSSESFHVLSSLVWRKMEEQHGRRRRTKAKISVLFWFFRNNSVPPSSPRSFRTQSYWSFITGQCHYSERFLPIHLSCRMCNQFTFHHQFRIDTGRTNLSNKQTVFFLPVDPMEKEHKDFDTIELGTQRLAKYMHKVWKKHQHTVYWVDINLAIEKVLKFFQTRSNAIILHETLPA